MHLLKATIAILVCSVATPAFAQESDTSHDDDTVILKPTSDWRLREMDDRCRLSRRFGSGEDRTTLWIDKGGPGPSVNITLIGRPFRHPYGPNLRIGFGSQELLKRNYITSTSSRGRPVISLFGVKIQRSPEAQENAPLQYEDGNQEVADILDDGTLGGSTQDIPIHQLSGLTSLNMEGALVKPVSLEIGPLKDAFSELRTCTNALTARLSGSSTEERDIVTGILPKDQIKWAKKIQANYPFHLLAERQEGSVKVRLTVSSQGRATFCEVTEYSGPASFNDTACLLILRHARFNPAINSDGEPVAGFFGTQVVYRIKR